MLGKNTIFINTRITPAERKAFDKRAKDERRKPADLLREVIREYLNG